MLRIVLGLVAILSGIVVMVTGSVLIGVMLLLGGVAATAFSYVTMMRGRGEDPNQGTINGLAGQGKQQSEAVKAELPDCGE